jgi:hypothetical protein
VSMQADGLPLEAFGVDGSASPADFRAWQAAIRTCLRTGEKLLGTPGAVYHFDPFLNGSLTVVPMTGQSFLLDLQQATLRFVDNMQPKPKAGFFVHQILVSIRRSNGATNQLPKLVRIENFITDGNLRNQTDKRIGSVVAEQMAHIKVICSAGDGNYLERVEFLNFRSVDPVADCILVGPSQAATLPDGSAGIGHLTVDGAHAGVRKSVRAFIVMGSGMNRAELSRISCDPMTGPEGNSIETEFASIGRQRVTINITDCEIDDIEIGGVRGKEDQLQMRLDRTVARHFALMVYCSASVRNSRLALSIRNAWQVRNAEFDNVVFQHVVFKTPTGESEVRPLYFISSAEGQHAIHMQNCRHDITGGSPDMAKNAMIIFGNDRSENFGQKTALIERAWFDPNCALSISNYAGWSVTTKSCDFAGTTSGVLTGDFYSGAHHYSGGWRSDSDNFQRVRGMPFEFIATEDSDADVVLNGGNWPSLNYRCRGKHCETRVKSNGRRMRAAKFPVDSGGVAGDEIWLDDAGIRSAKSGQPLAWTCTGSGPGGNRLAAGQFRVISRKN